MPADVWVIDESVCGPFGLVRDALFVPLRPVIVRAVSLPLVKVLRYW
jgi:hypothetical protein